MTCQSKEHLDVPGAQGRWDSSTIGRIAPDQHKEGRLWGYFFAMMAVMIS
jgi:hypothetical protein